MGAEDGICRKHLTYGGDCQGVGFRWNSQRAATQLGLTGWVRNLDDGSTEVEVQGTPDQIGLFYTAVTKMYQRFGMTPIITDATDVTPVPGETEYQIRY